MIFKILILLTGVDLVVLICTRDCNTRVFCAHVPMLFMLLSAVSAHLGCSLVKKDAGMLDAFGKGASDDIQAAKAELYAQVRSPASGPGHLHAKG